VPFDVSLADLLTIGLLVLLEGLLSADNALVLAILVLGLPRDQQRKALRYGILGAFFFRIIAIIFATQMIEFAWVKLVGGGYLLWLSYSHFFRNEEGHQRGSIKPARAWLGLSVFWTTVIKVELTDIVFAVDSILVAVAMSPKLWVIITGGVLGIVAMRLVIGQLLTLVQRYPALVDGAFVIIAWVAVKLFLEYAHQVGWVHFVIPKTVSLGLIVVIFIGSYLVARKQGPKPVDEETQRVLEDAD
jgi:YkoY family integral membrane protein